MFTAITSFLAPYMIQIIFVVTLLGLVATVYFQWKHQIETDALVNYNKTQIEQNIKDQKKFQDEQTVINKAQSDILDEAAKEQAKIQTDLDSVNDFLSDQTTVKNDHPASDILKQTIDKLRGNH